MKLDAESLKQLIKESLTAFHMNTEQEDGKVECSSCNGEGREYGETCVYCGGSGYMKICADCNGTGRTEPRIKCKNCRGTGQVVIEEDPFSLEEDHIEISDDDHQGFTDEPDYEGGMARNQLYTTCKDAHELIEMMKDNTELPAWCQSKITLAADYITTVRNYLEGEAHLHEKKRR